MVLRTLLLSCIVLGPLGAQAADEWPHLRGSLQSGRATIAGGTGERALGLRALWTAPLGPAYSGVAIAGGRIVTTYSNDEVDLVVALDQRDGAELWRRAIGPTYRGHDGSEDGPVSSPVIAGGTAFVLGPRGRLLALDIESGEERWSVHLVEDLGATPPEYGFMTTPIHYQGWPPHRAQLIVQAGGTEGRMLCAFDAETGEPSWSCGEGEAGAASPVIMSLGGRKQIVVLNDAEILGVDPEDGAVLWRHEFEGRDSASTGMAGPIGEGRFHASVSGGLATFDIQTTAAGYDVSMLYRSRELGRSYAAPVYHDGYLYGFNSSFLTCVDAATGRRMWKSRPPGGRGLIVLEDRLVVFGAEGVVTIAHATPNGYSEEARLQVLEHSSYTWPSLSSGCIFVRNSKRIACVAIEAGPATGEPVATATETAPRAAPAHRFGRFIEALSTADNKQERIDLFLEGQDQFPILEGSLVHFVFQGEVEDVALTGSMTEGGSPDTLQRVAGTNFYHRTYTIESGSRWEYGFQIDFAPASLDPLNTRTAPGHHGDVSEVLTPEYEVSTHYLDATGADAGRLDTFEFASETLGNAREVTVYLPHGYDDGDGEYPLLIVHQGPDWLEKGLMVNSLDNLIGARVRPVVVAFVAPIGMWWLEAGGSGTDEYLAMLATEFVPDLEERYRLSSRREDRALMGVRNFGLTAVYGALRQHEVFGKAAVQSVFLGDVARHSLFELLEGGPRRETQLYMDWNRYEQVDLDSGFDFRSDSRRLFEALGAAGYEVVGGEALDSHGWGSWRSRTDDLLEALFPMD